MGPIHNFAALAKNAQRVQGSEVAHDPRLAPSEAELAVDTAFETHPDLQSLMHDLDEWYQD